MIAVSHELDKGNAATSSDLPAEREAMKRWHAGYFQKTSDANEYMKLGQIAKALLDTPLLT